MPLLMFNTPIRARVASLVMSNSIKELSCGHVAAIRDAEKSEQNVRPVVYGMFDVL